MSEILNLYGRSPEAEKINQVVHLWRNTGLLYGLNKSEAEKVAVCFELAAKMMLIREDIDKISMNMINKYTFDDSEIFASVIFPIIRRVISFESEAYKYFPEMFSSIYKHMNSVLAIGVNTGNEECRRYFYDNKVIDHTRRKGYKPRFNSYDEMQRESYLKHGGESLMDWEAEYVAYVSDVVIDEIRSYE